jgi:CxxC motif-containing protein (DUF1111 family)
MKQPRAIVLAMTATTSMFVIAFTYAVQGQGATEAPAGFDNKTNGLISQAQFDADLATFEERDGIADGLGPVYNAQSCAECHQNPVTGGVSQISELRAGHLSAGSFVDAPGGSLINDRAIDARIQERVPGAENVRTLRLSTNTLGLGFVEAISNTTLKHIVNAQPSDSFNAGVPGIAGQAITVPVLEANNALRVGRFGWKNQNASLLSFAADAYLNEVGITNRFLPTENTSLGLSVAGFDHVADPEDVDNDIDVFAEFMRATKVPPRDGSATSADAVTGSRIFTNIGCGICHTPTIVTASPGTRINGGAFTVPAALGNTIIHPYSDFALHDVSTGDGIVQNGGQSTRNKVRTAPLWGVRTHDRHMHDGGSLTFNESILRHGGEATNVINKYRALGSTAQNQLITFLKSL